jgi:3-oxoadipate enol-lactonase
MPELRIVSGLAPIGQARIYCEIAGEGQPFVMIHAGVADHRQWNNEFAHFAQRFRVIRYDRRGYGESEPVDGEYSDLGDLTALLDHLGIDEPAIVMGCSMGGGVAMNLALAEPARVAALILVDSGPPGLELNVPELALFEQAEAAYEAGDFDRLAGIETRIWFDGIGRAPSDVDPDVRRLAYEMNRKALGHEAKGLGKRMPDAREPAAERLTEIEAPVLIVVGANDIPYMHAAADYMLERIPSARRVVIEDAAHLPNMEHPAEFRRLVTEFLESI